MMNVLSELKYWGSIRDIGNYRIIDQLRLKKIKTRGYESFFHAEPNWARNVNCSFKLKNPESEEVSCFQSLRCGIYHANKC